MRVKKLFLVILIFAFASCSKVDDNELSKSNRETGLSVADFLLSQQTIDGAIPDEPGGETVNIDSNMEYALIGLAAAYHETHDSKYLQSFEKGIHWLAAREEMTDTFWKGSWYYAFSSTSPYLQIAVSPGEGLSDVRGVDATSSLFVYLLYLHKKITGQNNFVQQYEQNATAALNFIISHNFNAGNGFFYSSWQKYNTTNQWYLWNYHYAADQGDVYLGLEAGSLLYGNNDWHQKANYLRQQTPQVFFIPSLNLYAIGKEDNGSPDSGMDGFNGIFPQGYLGWIFGTNPQNNASYNWLSSCVQTNGSLNCYTSDPIYSLSAATYVMSAVGLDKPIPHQSLNWIKNNTYDNSDGGIRDTASLQSKKFSNVQGLCIVALLNF